jgi:hypothetical protein
VRPPRTRLLALDDLDRFECDVPGCPGGAEEGRIYFRARCHPEAALAVRYERDGGGGPPGPSPVVGVLVLACARCRREVARVVVGSRPV